MKRATERIKAARSEIKGARYAGNTIKSALVSEPEVRKKRDCERERDRRERGRKRVQEEEMREGGRVRERERNSARTLTET